MLVWRDSAVETTPTSPPDDPFENPFGDPQLGRRPVVQSDPAPAPPFSQAPATDLAEDGSCRHVSNGRDCCKEADECRAARDRVRSNSILDISIDITPGLTTAKLELEDNGHDYRGELKSKLRESPERDWRNRDGEVMASGRLTDYVNGRAVVTSSDGTTARLPFAQLSDDDMCFVNAWWSIPIECSLGDEVFQQRTWVASTMTWKASGVCHKPLYFEDVQLERYGHSAGPILQPALSSAHFFASVVSLPYQMGINPPNECRYPLGYYRPGNCAPWLVPPVPLSIRGGLFTAGLYTGGVYSFP